MKFVGLTMRVEALSKIKEKRDSIDQRWYNFLDMCNLHPILIPNSESFVSEKYLNKLSGIILTGGNSLSHLQGDAQERDKVENKIVKYATEKNLPLMGVCRGMQILQNYYGVSIEKVAYHVGTRHNLIFRNQQINVNSFHNYGATTTSSCLEILATCSDNVIEAIQHRDLPFFGIMWHPERENSFSNFDIKLFEEHFRT
tara:strand:+ start:307 stop:903 length:597 start_codon:yes stop_codon:yes gene_type:complete